MVDASETWTGIHPHVSHPLYHCAADADDQNLFLIKITGKIIDQWL